MANHNFFNYKKAYALSNYSWSEASSKNILNITASLLEKNIYVTPEGKQFFHMASCSYLGLDSHPKIMDTAIEMLKKQRSVAWIASSRNRIMLQAVKDTEDALSDFFNAHAITFSACSAASSSILPLIAAGFYTDEQPPLMVFDKHAHFSMNHMKPLCAEETSVNTIPNNDLNKLEEICKQHTHSKVCYVSDGVNSMGGAIDLPGVIFLQKKYGLFLFIDDSHSLSSYGRKGYGYVRDNPAMHNENTITVFSLAKAFGAVGGMALLPDKKMIEVTQRYGGPMLWSQTISPAAIGAILGSLSVHQTSELNTRQTQLMENIQLFDSLIDTREKDSPFTVRIIRTGTSEKSIELCEFLFSKGFLSSAVFFPVVKKDDPGVRVMLRSDMTADDIRTFCNLVTMYGDKQNNKLN